MARMLPARRHVSSAASASSLNIDVAAMLMPDERAAHADMSPAFVDAAMPRYADTL